MLSFKHPEFFVSSKCNLFRKPFVYLENKMLRAMSLTHFSKDTILLSEIDVNTTKSYEWTLYENGETHMNFI